MNTSKMTLPPGWAQLNINRAGQQYEPGNGTEGGIFMSNWCGTCARDKSMREGAPIEECDDNEVCPIIARSLIGKAREWVWDANGQPSCTQYVEYGLPIPAPRCANTDDMFEGGAA